MTQPTPGTSVGKVCRLLLALSLLTALIARPDALAGSRTVAVVSAGSELRLIVQLSEPSLSEAGFGAEPASAALQALHSAWPNAQAYRQHLQAQQQALAVQLTAALPGAAVEYAYQAVFNGLAVRLPDDSSQTLAVLDALPGVGTVYEEVAYRPTLYASLGDIAVGGLWSAVGGAGQAGAGVKIAVLDSGIQTSHPMFGASGLSFPPGYPKGDARDASAKVIAARVYLRPGDPPLAGEDRPAPGKAGSAHGTHVAGIAAGVSVRAGFAGLEQQISGVAPRAWLMNYRIFYPTDGADELAYEAEILRAIEDAVLDGADVLCCSWSALSARAPEASPVGQALASAVGAGCVVVASAGDEGPGYGSVSRVPGALPEVITVGAVSKSAEIMTHLVDVVGPAPVPADMTAQPYQAALFGGTWQGVLGPFPVVDVRQADAAGSPQACGALSSAVLAGKVAVIARGGCDFADKAYNAQRAGALAVIIVNDSDELVPMSCVGSHCGAGVITVPVVMVTQSFGQRLANWAAVHPDASVRLDTNGRLLPVDAGVVQGYSGRGPAHLRFLKPDVVAPGRAVLSSWFSATGQPGYAQVSGSSMAAAHVAGAAALLMQEHPSWSPADVKSALMNTADAEGLTVGTEGAPASVLDRGAGEIDLTAAANPALLLAPPSASLGQVEAGGTYVVTLSLRDTRTSGSALTYAVLPSAQSGLSIVPATNAIALSPGQRATLALSLYVGGGVPSGELSGELYLVSGANRIHVPLWAHVLPSADTASVLVIDNDFSFYGAYRDYSGYITAALQTLGVSYRVWDADVHYEQTQTLPSVGYMQGFDMVIWLTGDNIRADGYYVVPTPLTKQDQAVLQAYLDGGGRLLAMGQNLAQASDIYASSDPTWGRSGLYHAYLGAHWLQGSLFDPSEQGYFAPAGRPSVVGWPGSAFAGLQLDLGALGDGARDQVSVDEIAPGGLLDGADADLVQPMLMAVEGWPIGDGCVAVGKSGDPTLERTAPAIPYRSLYFSFGLEGVNNNQGSTTRAELLQRSLDWLWDEVAVNLQPQVVAVHNATAVRCDAGNNSGYAITRYRWRVTDPGGVREVVTTVPDLTLLYTEPGIYDLAVEATDALGHSAVAQTGVIASYLGASGFTVSPTVAPRLGELVFRVVLRNSSGLPVSGAFSMPLPAGTDYISHVGGSYAGNVYRWTGTLEGEASLVLQLRVRIRASTPSGSMIRGEGTFTANGVTFARSAQALVRVPLYVPLVFGR